MQMMAKFLRTPRDLMGKAILLQVDKESLALLREYTKDHQAAQYLVDIKRNEKRSLSQNDKFHALVEELAEKSGYTKDEAKALMKHRYGVTFPWRQGSRPPPSGRDGCFVETYGEIEFQVSTACYTKAEFIPLIEGVERELAEIEA
jgi:hypothetical protein